MRNDSRARIRIKNLLHKVRPAVEIKVGEGTGQVFSTLALREFAELLSTLATELDKDLYKGAAT